MDFQSIKQSVKKLRNQPFERSKACVDYSGNLCLITKAAEVKNAFETFKMQKIWENKMEVECEIRIAALFDSGILGEQVMLSTELIEAKKIPEQVYENLFIGLKDMELKDAIVDVFAVKGEETAFIESWLFIMDC